MPTYGMYTLTTQLILWTALCLLLAGTHAQDTSPDRGDVTVAKVVPVGGDGKTSEQPESSYQVVSDKPSPATPSQVPLMTDIPDFRLSNEKGVCLRAVFRATFVIQYMTKGPPKTKMLSATIELPTAKSKETRVSGECGDKKSTLAISWHYQNNSFTLTMVFQKVNIQSSFALSTIPSWEVSSLVLAFDTRNNSIFPNIVPAEAGVMASTAAEEVHFSTPANYSYRCSSQEDITLQVYLNKTVDTSVINTVSMSLWDTRMQGFNVEPTADFSLGVQCKGDLEKSLPHRNIVPMVVAACLAAVIVIIVVVYFIMKNKSQSIYSAMD